MWVTIIHLFCFVVQKRIKKENLIPEGENMCHYHLFCDLKFVLGINNLALDLGYLYYYFQVAEKTILWYETGG